VSNRCTRIDEEPEFLTSIAAFGVTTAVITSSSVSQSTARSARPQLLIDVHHHIFPPAFLVAARDAFRTSAGRARLVSEWTAQKALAQMDSRSRTQASGSEMCRPRAVWRATATSMRRN
jgi:hypothetical protein